MATLDYTQLTKIQKIAAFFIFIGPETAGKVMKEFEKSQLEAICREMAALDLIDEALQRHLLAEFGGIVADGVNSLLGGASYAQTMMEVANVTPTNAGSDAGEEIRQMDARQILNLLRAERPQTIAFILSYLNTAKAAEIVMMLTPEMRDDVVERLGAMDSTSRDVVQKIVKNMNRHVDRRSLQRSVHLSGGVKTAADLLNALDRDTRKAVLSSIEERNPPLGASIRKKVFRFEDLVRLGRVDLQRIMREINMSDLALSLKGAKPMLMNAILNAVSKRAGEDLKDDIEMLGQVKVKEIEAAQDRIIEAVRKLEEADEISFDSGGEQSVG